MWFVYRYRETGGSGRHLIRAVDLDRAICPTVMSRPSHAQVFLMQTPPIDAVVTQTFPVVDHPTKPPYRVPLMAEIREVPWNGLTWVSTFSGTGGTSTGARMAGYRVLAAVEFVPAAVASYRANCAPYTKVFQRDVREITGQEILKAVGLKRGQLDVLDGSPPCEPFSTAGSRDQHWGQVVAYSGQQQRTDDLLHQFIRLVDEIRPRVFVAENVKGLVTGRAKGYYKRVMADMRALGYVVESRILDAQWLGVPQHRERVIIVGVRANLRPRRKPAFPRPLPYNYTVRDALSHIAKIGTDPNFDRRRREMMNIANMMVPSDRPHATVQCSPSGAVNDGASGANGYCEEVVGYEFDTQGARQGPPRDRLDEAAPTITNGGLGNGGGTPACHHQVTVTHRTISGVTTVMSCDQGNWHAIEQIVGNDKFEPVFGTLDVASPTILATGARTSGEVRETDGAVTRRRTLTIPELRRISGFPDDFELVGTFSQQWERLGDCVPPPMAYAYAAAIRDHILDTRRTP